MIDLKIVKITGYDAYCGSDYLCTQGAEQSFSVLLWIVILVSAACVGGWLERNSIKHSRKRKK